MNLNIVHWNCRSIKNKKSTFLPDLINKHNVDILCLSETHLLPTDSWSYPTFNFISKPRMTALGGGVGFLLAYHLKFVSLDPFHQIFLNLCNQNNVEISIIKVFIEHDSIDHIIIVTVYSPPRPKSARHTSNTFWNQFFSYVDQFNNLIVCGDFNAKNDLWNSTGDHDKEGDKIVNALINSNLSCLNNGEITFGKNVSSLGSTLDLTFISPSLSSKCQWNVIDDKFDSDHFPISLSFNKILRPYVVCRPQIYLKKVDWTLFKLKCENSVISISPDSSTESAYNDLIDEIKSALLESGAEFRDKKNVKKSTFCFWWSVKCDQLILEKKQAFTQYKNNPSAANLISFQNICKDVKKKLRKLKDDAYKSFVSSLNRTSDMAATWKIIKNIKNKKNRVESPCVSNFPSFEKAANKFEKITDQSLNISCDSTLDQPFIDNFFSSDINFLFKDFLSSDEVQSESMLTKEISREEYLSSLNSTKVKTAPGPDLITNEILLKLPDRIHNLLLVVFNKILIKGDIPSAWREYFAVFIPKANGEDVRPIALSSCVQKLFEKIICRRLNWWSENENIVPISQTGFRKLKCVTDAVGTLVTDIKSGFNKKKFTGCVFLDIEGAFDNVDIFLLSKLLLRLKFPMSFVKLIFNLMRMRKMLGYNDGKLIGTGFACKGVPQGSGFSPDIFNIYSSKVSSVIPEHSNSISYADDHVIYSTSDNLPELFSNLNESVNLVHRHFNSLNLNLAPTKSNAIIFSKKSTSDDIKKLNLKLSCNNENISIVEKTKYLGIILDSKLNWSAHIKYINQNARKALNVMKALSGFTWGAHPSVLLAVYKGLIRSNLDWGSQLFDGAYCTLSLLDKTQFAAIRCILGLMCSTPTNVLLDLIGEPPLECRRRFLRDKHVAKISAFKHHPLKNAIDSYISSSSAGSLQLEKKSLVSSAIDNNDLLRDIIKFNRPGSLNFCFEVRFFDCSNLIDLSTGSLLRESDNPNNYLNDLIEKEFSNFVKIYTDGSRSLDPSTHAPYTTGFALVAPQNNYCYKAKINPNFSIMYAEACAILYAIKYILNNHFENSIIFSDSKSTLINLSSCDKKGNLSTIIYLIKILLLEARSKNYVIKMMWIPSHVGILGNESADKLAKESLKLEEIFLKKIYFENTFPLLKSNMFNLGKSILSDQSLVKGKTYFQLKFPKNILNKPWWVKFNLDRKCISIISRIRSGHVRTNSHLFDKNIIESPLCDCGIIQDLNHVVFSCPLRDNHYADNLMIGLWKSSSDYSNDVREISFSGAVDQYRLLAGHIKKFNIDI